jgi:hypothetical protein
MVGEVLIPSRRNQMSPYGVLNQLGIRSDIQYFHNPVLVKRYCARRNV